MRWPTCCGRTGCPPIPTYSLDFGGLALRGWPTPYDGVALAYGPRRIVLDRTSGVVLWTPETPIASLMHDFSLLVERSR